MSTYREADTKEAGAKRRPWTLEFKRDLSSPDGALKTIVAFANTSGGTLLIGVEDRARHVRGVPDALDLEGAEHADTQWPRWPHGHRC